ncbi:MAG: MlaA family lipoprotein [Caulobacterales bacterium]
MKRVLVFAAAFALIGAGPVWAQGQVSSPYEAASTAHLDDIIADPWETTNRRLFGLHERLDKAALEPTARGYRTFTPRWLRLGVGNVLRNLRGPVILVNDVLQGEFTRAGVTAARFGVNTTIGIGGTLDVAERMGLERHEEDFGETLAAWGVPAGPYLFVPLVGPMSVRDGFGRMVDTAINPLTFADFEGAQTANLVRAGFTGLATRESLLEAVDTLRETAIDPYASVRNGYGLMERSAARNGRSDVEDLPQFEEISDDMRLTPEPGQGEAASTDSGEVSQDPPTTQSTEPEGVAPSPETPDVRSQQSEPPPVGKPKPVV